MMARPKWLEEYYLAVKIIAIISGSLITISLAPLTEFWKGFLVAGLIFSFLWLLIYFKFNRKVSKK